ncbi:MAG: urease accessory protein UreD [Endozoicomonas sp.]
MTGDVALPETGLQWYAGLEMQLISAENCTRLGRTRHYGPLRIQRPFWPEGPELAHIYTLHPPGGLVAGDELIQQFEAGPGAAGLVTTPSAGKVYFNNSKRQQKQNIVIRVADQAGIEWLPQETILFDGADAVMSLDVQLSGKGTYIGWDILCLGRQASGESFDSGRLLQTVNLSRNGLPLFRDRLEFTAGDDRHQGLLGLHKQPVLGTMLATVNREPPVAEWHGQLVEPCASGQLSLTWRAGVLIVRYLGDSSRQARELFEKTWALCRPMVNDREACRPRIWNT